MDMRALFDFVARSDDELTLSEGQLYDAVEQLDDEWWRVRDPRTDEVGDVPASYVEKEDRTRHPIRGVEATLYAALVAQAPQLMAHGFAELDLSANMISKDSLDNAFSEFFAERVVDFHSGWLAERSRVHEFLDTRERTRFWILASERVGAALERHGALICAAGFSLDRIRAIAAPAPIKGTVVQLALCFATFLMEENESGALDEQMDALLAEWGAIEQSLAAAMPALVKTMRRRSSSSSSSSTRESSGDGLSLAVYRATCELVEKELKFVWETQVLCDDVFAPLSAYVASGSLGRTNAADVDEIFTGCEALLIHHKTFLAGLLGISDVALFDGAVQRFGRAAKEARNAAREISVARYAAHSATTRGAQRIADARAARKCAVLRVTGVVEQVAPRAGLADLLARAPRAFEHLFKMSPFRAQLAATKAYTGHGSEALALALSSDAAFKAEYGVVEEAAAAKIGKGVEISTPLRPPLYQRVMRYGLHLDGIAKALRNAVASRGEGERTRECEGEVNAALARARGAILATGSRVEEALRQVDSAMWTLSDAKRRTIAVDLFARLAKKFDGADAVVVASELEQVVECTGCVRHSVAPPVARAARAIGAAAATTTHRLHRHALTLSPTVSAAVSPPAAPLHPSQVLAFARTWICTLLLAPRQPRLSLPAGASPR